MDVVTHAMCGVVLAAPFAERDPVAAATFVLASVVPDLDVLARAGGQRAFLEVHQRWSHALPVIAALGLVGLLVGAPLAVALALVAGMGLHALLDWTNTYGVSLWLPFGTQRRCGSLVFFVDPVVIGCSVGALAWTVLAWPAGPAPAVAYATALLGYVLVKAVLRRRALARCPPQTVALVPSAAVPWRWFGCSREGDSVHLFRVNGGVSDEGRAAVLDTPAISSLPAFRTMRTLSDVYHAVERNGDRVVCKDLRTRNFGGRFGMLEVDVSEAPRVVRWHV